MTAFGALVTVTLRGLLGRRRTLLMILLAALPVLVGLFRWVVPERMGIIIISAILAHSAWHWMASRFATLREYRFVRPALDTVLLAGLLRWVMLLFIVLGVIWALSGTLSRLARPAGIGNRESGIGT